MATIPYENKEKCCYHYEKKAHNSEHFCLMNNEHILFEHNSFLKMKARWHKHLSEDLSSSKVRLQHIYSGNCAF